MAGFSLDWDMSGVAEESGHVNRAKESSLIFIFIWVQVWSWPR